MNSSLGEGPSGAEAGRELLMRRQAEALERLAEVSDPEYKPRQRVYGKLAGLVVAGSGAVLAGYEFILFVLESQERRAMVANWVEASRELFEVEGSAAEAGQLVARAAEVAPQDPDVVKLSAYIDGMGVVERLVNLDRPFDVSDVEAYGRAMGQAVMLERVAPEDPEWAILRGQLALAAREPDRAQVFIEQALRLDPGNAFATLRLSLVHLARYQQSPKADDAQAQLASCRLLLDRALALEPSLKWGRLWKGALALEIDGDAAAAARDFEAAIELDPRFASAWASLGGARERQEDWAGAEKAYARALEIRPDISLALVGLAYVYGAQDRYEIGLRYARRATELDAKGLKAWNMRGLLAREVAGIVEDEESKSELLSEAIDAYSKALDLDPRSADAYIERSKLNRRAGNLREAGDDARDAVSFAPDDPYAWDALAKFQAAAGLVDQAEETFTKVIAIDPGFDTALLERAKCRHKRGNTAGASADLDAALAVATDDFRVDVLLERAGTREQDARTAEALADYVEARTLQTNSFDAWMGEARCLRLLGRLAESAQAATSALELRPDDAEAKALSGR